MKKVHIELISGQPHIPLLFPNLGTIDRPERLFTNDALQTLREPIVEIVEDPAIADYFLVPHDFYRIALEKEYFARVVARAEEHGKKILIFDYSDYDSPIEVPDSIVFRYSQYRYKKATNEIIAAPFVEDLGARGVALRAKGERPVVGFCGWADFDSLRRRLRYYARLLLVEAHALFQNSALRAHRPGLYFRRAALARLRDSALVVSNFLIRKTFSAHAHSITSDPQTARREYIENMVNSDFVLAPKGDGNYSMRFYEALSLGRIPLLIDTETELPLESEIDYSSFVLRVSYKDMDRLPQIVADFYAGLTEEEFKAMQERARAAFVEKLFGEAFLRYAFAHLL
ncbi:glycosyltransferase family 47 protein [Candidatus Parcubacteria bacterium]|nr:glycosyltransferase family 47 protein [Candidatus Parcubacteria bacterium]